ncbi:dihydrodipicolinate reductase [bacterium]|nr:dihydrodipicolinate reductase [bacterium]
MKVGLIGYGKMGKMIELLADDSISIDAVFDETPAFLPTESVRKKLVDVDCVIDFSIPDAAMQNIRTACDLGVSMVMGTTGWIQHLSEVQQMVESAGIGFVHASNFSIGVNLFYKIIDHAAKLVTIFEDYDPFLYEAHHKYKLDAPSGTALNLKKMVQDHYPGQDVDICSTRAGYIPGTHVVGFDSSADTIELRHTARSREGFAKGAILAAKWLKGKKGCFDFDEIIESFLRK